MTKTLNTKSPDPESKTRVLSRGHLPLGRAEVFVRVLHRNGHGGWAYTSSSPMGSTEKFQKLGDPRAEHRGACKNTNCASGTFYSTLRSLLLAFPAVETKGRSNSVRRLLCASIRILRCSGPGEGWFIPSLSIIQLVLGGACFLTGN